jgi:peptidoglycan/xylan/chitin deacetylase (PgdA/CDA1 family)
MSKRQLLGNVLGLIPYGITRQVRQKRKGRYLTVLTYHRVLDVGLDFPFDEDLVSASSQQFDEQLSFIGKHFNVINFKMLREHMEGGAHLPDRPLILTFDDGYIDNFEVAYPLLRKHNMTGTMFVAAGYISRNRLFWWDKIAYIVKSTDKSGIELQGRWNLAVDFERHSGKQGAARHVIKWAKTKPDEEKEAFILELAEHCGVEFDENNFCLTMTWENLLEMSNNGIEIGAHSVNHPIFSNVDVERLRDEVIGSKQMIEERLGSEVVAFGAPGRGRIPAQDKLRFEENLKKILAEGGFSYSSMYRFGLAYERNFDPYMVSRIGIESYDGALLFRGKVGYPEWVTY